MALIAVVAFLLVPIVEIYVIVQVGQVIGAWPTVALLLAESLLGSWLVRREGRRTWRALRDGLATGRMPSRELLDGGLVLIGGTLLLTPGFVTDVVGFALLLPLTRPIARRALQGWLTRRVVRMAMPGAGGSLFGFGTPPRGPGSRGAAGRPPTDVIPGEVLPPRRPSDGDDGTY